MTYNSGICVPWIEPEDVDCGEDVTIEDDVLASSVTAAIEVLFALSGSQFPGLCETIITPTACSCSCYRRNGYPGTWSNVSSAIELGYDPIRDVTEVLIDGVLVDPSAYRVEEDYWLVRQDGNLWPCQQHRDRATTEADTWSVEIEYGEDPPQMGIIAAKAFACQLARAQTPGATCQLPKRVQNISRQGMSMVLIDPFDFLEKRRSGIFEVDLFLNTYNPEDLQGNAIFGSVNSNPIVIRTTS